MNRFLRYSPNLYGPYPTTKSYYNLVEESSHDKYVQLLLSQSLYLYYNCKTKLDLALALACFYKPSGTPITSGVQCTLVQKSPSGSKPSTIALCHACSRIIQFQTTTTATARQDHSRTAW